MPVYTLSEREQVMANLQLPKLCRVLKDNASSLLTTIKSNTERLYAEKPRPHFPRRSRGDYLTGLPRRSWFMHCLAATLANTRTPGPFGGVLCIDLDNFKSVNHTLGHHEGDQLIAAVACRLRSWCRSNDMVTRLHGAQFAVLLTELAHPREVLQIAERLRTCLYPPIQLTKTEVFTSASIGATWYEPFEEGVTAATLLHRAEMAMYQAKQQGKNQVVCFDAGMQAQMKARMELETELRRGIAHGEFCTFYQPIMDLKTGGLQGAEALVRWEHPQRGLLTPAAFITTAHESGQIQAIDQAVFAESCRQFRQWQADVPAMAPFRMSINVAPRSFLDPQLVAHIRASLSTTGIDPAQIEIEITENTLMEDTPVVRRNLAVLHDLGIRLAIDDFGTGYSSLSYLHQLPAQTLKIDQSFIQALDQASGATPIVRAVISMAHELGMSVTAEGVETEAQLAHARDLGCDRAQGYLIAPPLPSSAMTGMLTTANAGSTRFASVA